MYKSNVLVLGVTPLSHKNVRLTLRSFFQSTNKSIKLEFSGFIIHVLKCTKIFFYLQLQCKILSRRESETFENFFLN